MLQIALYRGPAKTLGANIFHRLVCLRTLSPWSHIELVVGHLDATGHATCLSSSARDKGVRQKRIDLTTGRWDVLPLAWLTADQEAAAVAWFTQRFGAKYDYTGLLGFVLPWRTEARRKYFCSEAVAAALGLPKPWRHTPQSLATWAGERAQVFNRFDIAAE